MAYGRNLRQLFNQIVATLSYSKSNYDASNVTNAYNNIHYYALHPSVHFHFQETWFLEVRPQDKLMLN